MSIYKHYTIVIHKKSEKFLDTIPIEDQKKCINKIDSLINDNYKTLNIKKTNVISFEYSNAHVLYGFQI